MQNTISKKHSKSPINNHLLSLKDFETKLAQIFNDELNSSNSIFLRISDRVVHKAALFLSGYYNRSCAIGIAGETASGKTTIANEMIKALLTFAEEVQIKNFITKINMDNYYFDRSEEVKKAFELGKK